MRLIILFFAVFSLSHVEKMGNDEDKLKRSPALISRGPVHCFFSFYIADRRKGKEEKRPFSHLFQHVPAFLHLSLWQKGSRHKKESSLFFLFSSISADLSEWREGLFLPSHFPFTFLYLFHSKKKRRARGERLRAPAF